MTTLADLASQYNALATARGRPTVRRFSDRSSAERCPNALRALVPPPPQDNNSDGLKPLRWYTEQFNALVPEALRRHSASRHVRYDSDCARIDALG
jgi:hypothetical protein